ncbi:MAG: glycosyltransferase [Prevotellaceae bacterium]|jgi:spore maturation protein CgeB|nr:glycosyltransferase [Prevotellaceae bacterium]
MKPRVLIIGPNFFGYNHSIKKAFELHGYEGKVVGYDGLIHPFNTLNKVLNKFFFCGRQLKKRSQKSFNKRVKDEYESFKPNLVFIFNGDILTAETISYFKKQSKVAVWLLDGTHRHPNSVALASGVDAYFCFDRRDAMELAEDGINVYFLPQAYDPEVYYPMSNVKKDIDVIFIGMLYGYPKRIRLLKMLANEIDKNYKFQVYGVYKPIYKNPVKWLFREKHSVFKNRNIPPEKVNELYNRSRMCINIHHQQSEDGANPKTFEICGAGTFQIVDYNKYIAEVYTQEEVAVYNSDSEFMEKVMQSLQTDVSDRAKQAHEKVRKYHTFEQRILEVLDILGMGE